jgi:PPP family 3-phenylpropionic acid transporter
MKKHYYNYVGIYSFTYGAMGMMLPLLGQYLSQIGFTGAEIGSVMSTGTGVAIFASIFWGNRYSKSREGKRVILFLCLAAAMVTLVLSSITTYLYFLITFGLLYFFQSPILALQDSMTLEDDQDFSHIRKWGAIGYGLGNFIASRVILIAGLKSIFFLFMAGYLLAAFLILWIRYQRNQESGPLKKSAGKTVRQDSGTAEKGRYRDLLQNRKFVLLIISAFFVSGTNVANNTYFSFLYIEGGGTLAGVGIAFLLMVGSEAVFMAWSGRLSAIFTLERMILYSMIVSVLRYAFYALNPSFILLIGTFFLQGMVNGIVLVEFIRYIAKLLKPKMLGLGLSVYYCVSCNISTIVCLLIGGLLLDFYGAAAVYLFFSLYNLLGVSLYLLWGLHKEEKDYKKVEITG